jgi:hypothetical protein
MNGIKTSICNVYYEELPNIDPKETSRFYYLYNHFKMNEEIQKEYEDYETNQIHIRNRIISNAIKNGRIPNHPKMESTIFGVSSLKNVSVIIAEY